MSSAAPNAKAGARWTWERREADAEVLFVTNMWPDSERPVYGIFVQRQVESLIQEGVRCDVLYIRGYKGFSTYPFAAGWLLLHRKAICRRYALVHAHAGEAALAIGGLQGTPRVASYCGDDILGQADVDGEFSRRVRLRRWLIKQSARYCTVTITKSREMDAALPLRAQEHNSVIPNGVNERDFRPVDRAEARRILDWDQYALIVIFVATRPHEPRKRLGLAQESVAEAEQNLGPIQLFVAEDVAPSELPMMMNAADCMLLTSRMEGSPNAVKEALMCNLPVVSTDVGDVAALLRGVDDSAICQDTPSDLGTALTRILERRRRSNGREKRSELKQSQIAAQILEIYQRAGYEPSTIGS